MRYRDSVMQLFGPKKATLKEFQALATFFNGDWRSSQVTHYCNKCCFNMADSKLKAQRALMSLLRLAKPRVSTKGNWRHWQQAYAFPSLFGSIHSLLFEVVPKVLQAMSGQSGG